MKYVHYDKNTGKILGFFDNEIHPAIPKPNLKITDEQWREAINNNYNYVDIESKTLSKKDFRTLEQVKEFKIKELKQIRDDKVKEIKVTLSTGEYLDGNELAQTRMSRAIQALPDDTTELDWIDANNNTIKLTKPKFSEALVLAGQEETKIFTEYNALREQVNNCTTIEDIQNIKLN